MRAVLLGWRRHPRLGRGSALSCAVGARRHRAHSRRAVAARIRLRPVGGRYPARWTGVRRGVESRLTVLAWPSNGRIGGRGRPSRGRAQRLRRRASRNDRSGRRSRRDRSRRDRSRRDRSRRWRGSRSFRSNRRLCSRPGQTRRARGCPVTPGQSAAVTTQVTRLIVGTAWITSLGRALGRLLRRPSFA